MSTSGGEVIATTAQGILSADGTSQLTAGGTSMQTNVGLEVHGIVQPGFVQPVTALGPAIFYTVGAAAGTGATLTGTGNVMAGTLTLVTGATALTAGGLGHTNAVGLNPTGWGIALTPTNAAAAAQATNLFVTSAANVPLALNAISALAASTTYEWSYVVVPFV